MKRLEEIGKKNPFEVPEGYFDALPTIIQSRVSNQKSGFNLTWVTGLKYALPLLAISISLYWFFKPQTNYNPEDLLASVSSLDIADYLHSIEIPTDDFMESIDYTQLEVDSLNLNESNILLEDVDFSEILNDLNEEPLNSHHE